jgi:integrase
MPFDFESELHSINDSLRDSGVALSIMQRRKRLVLRGTLPPRPGSDRTKPHRQIVPIGRVFASAAGLRAARKTAQRIWVQLEEGVFNWADWVDTLPENKTIKQWVRDFEIDYFARRGKTPKTETTWDKDYKLPFAKLPQDVSLTAERLKTAAFATSANTRTRQRYCTAYNALAKFAEIDCNLSSLRGNYSPKAVDPRTIPSDDQVMNWAEQIQDSRWRTFFQLVATYGLRNHEVFYVDLHRLKSNPLAAISDGKTGAHTSIPLPLDWWERWFKGKDLDLPKINWRRNSDIGRLSAQYFKRQSLPFHLYDLRHAWSIRCTHSGIDPAIAAQLQGHSLKVHSDIYLRSTSERDYLEVLHKLGHRDSGGVE